MKPMQRGEKDEATPETGAAGLRVTLKDGTLTVLHDETGDTLLQRPMVKGEWDELFRQLKNGLNAERMTDADNS